MNQDAQLGHATAPHAASITTYLAGFVLAVILTVTAFAAVIYEVMSGYALMTFLLALAIIQAAVQLWFFLHLGREEKPRWNAIFLLNTIGIIVLIVAGSIWIMNSLNSRMMTPEQMEEYAIEEGSKGF